MSNISTKIRIKDIATLAGVSEGTVDRVLHNRGDVSEKSREAVTKVLEEMNYSPNLFARSLASKKHYRFVCLFPSHQPADYWQSVDDGFDIAAKEFIHYNVEIEKIYFDQFDVNSFIQISNNILENEPDAVLIAPIFKEEGLKFTNELSKRHIPFSFIDSMIEEADFVTYYGQYSFQSGYIAAKLLLNSLAGHAQVLVIRTQRNGAVSNQTLNRYNGFMHYIEENNLKDKIDLINIELKDDDENANLEQLTGVFSVHKNIKAAITFNSKVFRLAMHLETLKHTDVQLIGYDLLDQNVAYLQQDVISYLIAQRPEKQAYFTVRDMCNELIFNQEVTKINYVPIDILIKENIEYYNQFKDRFIKIQ
jgi:LacI family transcriptional regulator